MPGTTSPAAPPPGGVERGTTVLALHGVTHWFGTLRALDAVSLDVRAGEVHALVGENGAGKSTLLKVVSGLVRPTDGVVEVAGARLATSTRRASVAAGVGVVHQHFSLVGSLTGVENFALGRPGRRRRVDRAEAARTLVQWSERTGLAVRAGATVDSMSVVERQRLEILTALGWGARVLLLDEPTAVLSPVEADQLLGVVTQLAAAEGLGVVLVTHKLREVEQFADRATVLRAGAVVGRHDRGGFDRDTLIAEMVGASRDDAVLYRERREGRHEAGAVVVRARGLTGERLRGIDLEFRAGEVTGVAGVAGSGQDDLLGAISGLAAGRGGRVEVLDGSGATEVGDDAGRAARLGVALIPADRDRDALAPDLPVWQNAVAKQHDVIARRGGIDRAAVRAVTTRVIEALGVRPARHDLPAGSLSGGNQQRLVIGRELDRAPTVVLAAEPTRGLDPGSALVVLDALRAAARRGATVIVCANDLDELLLLSDRIVALCDGRVTLDVPVEQADRQRVGRAMAGVA